MSTCKQYILFLQVSFFIYTFILFRTGSKDPGSIPRTSGLHQASPGVSPVHSARVNPSTILHGMAQ